MSFEYDVVIVGAGPIGSTLAYKLALNNFKVCLIDKKEDIGVPLQCAGILSKDILNLNDLPSEIILNEVKGAYLNSLNETLKVYKNKTEAYIIDRVKYDKFLLKRAIDEGVIFKHSLEVNKVDSKKRIVYTDTEEIKGKIIVASDGASSKISKQIKNKQKFYYGVQFLIETEYNIQTEEYVHIFVNSEVLPGFIWLIPLKDNKYRMGLFGDSNFKKGEKILKNFIDSNMEFKNTEILDKFYGKIPIYNKNNLLVKDNIVLLGDAAGQIKPTTGGGLILGFNAVNIVEEFIIKALNENNYEILGKYEETFKKEFEKELNIQLKVHETLNMLSDKDLDYFFLKFREKNGEELINTYGEMDKQSLLVKEFIKNGYLFKVFPKLLFKRISKIWGVKK